MMEFLIYFFAVDAAAGAVGVIRLCSSLKTLFKQMDFGTNNENENN